MRAEGRLRSSPWLGSPPQEWVPGQLDEAHCPFTVRAWALISVFASLINKTGMKSVLTNIRIHSWYKIDQKNSSHFRKVLLTFVKLAMLKWKAL